MAMARVIIIAAALGTIWRLHGTIDFAISLSLFAFAAFAISGYARWLAMPATLWLGAISYPLYLIHRNLGYFSLGALHREGWPTWLALICAVTGALVLATLLTYFVERPLCRYLRVAYARSKVSAPAAKYRVQ
jgi:peptidoglycan/LPS O-acetylase OafA/YrhL